MSIESKHAYRFGYLKSDKWKQVRLDALLREKGKCQICAEESIFNDAHHVWYPPEGIYETKESHLVILCRPCHDFLHIILPECKTSDEGIGKSQWLKFSQAMTTWRFKKAFLFENGKEIDISVLTFGSPRELRQRLSETLVELQRANEKMLEKGVGFDSEIRTPKKKDKDLLSFISQVKQLIYSYEKNASCVNSNLAEIDFQI